MTSYDRDVFDDDVIDVRRLHLAAAGAVDDGRDAVHPLVFARLIEASPSVEFLFDFLTTESEQKTDADRHNGSGQQDPHAVQQGEQLRLPLADLPLALKCPQN